MIKLFLFSKMNYDVDNDDKNWIIGQELEATDNLTNDVSSLSNTL